MSENYFKVLNAVDVGEKIEKKGKLSYLSWAYAWGEIKKIHPDATYTVYENADGLNYHTDGRYCWVKTGVTVNGIEHIEYLPILDARSLSIKLENVTSYDVNKSIQRSITKACARHGLGLYVYAGEDLPEDESDTPPKEPARGDKKPAAPQQQATKMAVADQKQFIIDNATDEQYQAAMDAYGPELERMPYAHAAKLIAKIQKGMNANG